jgi:hypothetical protein
MTPDIPEADGLEDEAGYVPEPMGLSDGDLVIFDRAEFEQDFDCYAAINRGGQLFVLGKSDRHWRPAEQPANPRRLGAVQ